MATLFKISLYLVLFSIFVGGFAVILRILMDRKLSLFFGEENYVNSKGKGK